MRRRASVVLVLAGLLAWVAMPLGRAIDIAPGLTAGPSPALPGATVDVQGYGFGATEAVDVFFGASDLQLVVTEASGAFTASLKVPADAVPGTQWLSALGRRSGTLAHTTVTVLGTSSWPQQGYNAARTSWNPDERALRAATAGDLEPIRQSELASDGWVQQAVASSDAIFIALWGQNGSGEARESIVARDAMTGAQLWERPFGAGVSITMIALAGDVVYATVEQPKASSLRAIDAVTGNEMSSVQLGSAPHAYLSELLIDGATAYVTMSQGETTTIEAVDLSTMTQRWHTDLRRWINALAIGNGTLVVGHQDGMSAYDTATGALVWDASRPGGWMSSDTVAVVNGMAIGQMYLGKTNSNAVVALDLRDGRLVWSVSWQDEYLWLHDVAAHGDTLILAGSYWESPNGELWSIDPATGAVRWTERGQFWGGLVAGGNVVYAAGGGGLLAFDARTGARLASLDDAMQVHALVNGRVIATDSGADRGLVLRSFGLGTPVAPKSAALVPDTTMQPDRQVQAHTALTDGWTQLPIATPAGDIRTVGTTTFAGETYVGTEGKDGGGLFVVREDGLERVGQPGFGDPRTTTLTPMAVGSTLYVVGGNDRDGLQVFRSADGTTFTRIAERGLGDPENTDALPMAIAGRLVLGVTNARTGAQLWTVEPGAAPAFEKVLGVPSTRLDGFTPPVSFDGATYVGTVGAHATSLLRTTDAQTWTEVSAMVPTATTAMTPQTVTGDVLYVIASSPNGMELLASDDGETFRLTGPTDTLPQDVAITGQLVSFQDTLYLVGSSLDPRATPGKTPVEVAPERPFRLWRSTDGTTWTRVRNDAFADPHDVAATMLVGGDELYLAVQNFEEGDTLFRSSDGATWTATFREDSASHASTGLEPLVAGSMLVISHGDVVTGMTAWRADALIGAGGGGQWLLPLILLAVAIAGGAAAVILRRPRRTPPPAAPKHVHAPERELTHV